MQSNPFMPNTNEYDTPPNHNIQGYSLDSLSLPEIPKEIIDTSNVNCFTKHRPSVNPSLYPQCNKPMLMKDCTIYLTPIVPMSSLVKPKQLHLFCTELVRASLFNNLDDENLFLRTFSSFIVQVSHGEKVLEEDVWKHAHLNFAFAPLLHKFSDQFPNSISKLIMKKVRTTGFSISSKRYGFS